MSDGVSVLWVRVRGALAEYAPGFAEVLLDRGYIEGSARLQLQLMAWVSRWLEAEGLDVGGFTELQAERYIAGRRAKGYRLFRSRRALEPLTGYLASVGALPPPLEQSRGPAEELLERYRRYLLVERGLRPGSVHVYVEVLQPFVAQFATDSAVELERLTAAEVSAFVLAEASRRRGTSIRSVATALRSLLGYLHVQGLIERSLTGAVPGVGAWRQAGLPRPLERGELGGLIDSCSRSTAIGRRDRAMLLLMGRLGLRSCEVVGLALDDIDWRSGELLIIGKGRRYDGMPLPVDVGRAIVAYLRDGRPRTARGREVFVRSLAPHQALTPLAVNQAVHRAGERAELGAVNAHRLRHTAATELLRAGSELPEVGLVLRHRRMFCTAIYAKVDESALCELAQPWPGEWS